MELVQQTPKERFEKASEAISKHCFEAGRLKYVIDLDEDAVETKRLALKNMRVDFDKLNKELQKATELFFAAEKAAKSEKEALPETLN